MGVVKDILRQAVVRLFQPEPVRRFASRAVWLSRFHTWCAAHPCRAFATRTEYFAAVRGMLATDDVDYLEFGVYKGDSIRWWVDQLKAPGAAFHGFDTFTGLPEDWTPDKPRGFFSTEGQIPVIADPRCQFHAGLFSDTLPGFLSRLRKGRRRVVHLDADLYTSTIYVLNALAPYLDAGDILMFDEYQDYMDEFRAFEEFCTLWRPKYEVLAQNGAYTQVAMRLLGPAS